MNTGTAASSEFDWDSVDPDAQDAVQLAYPSVFWKNGKSELESLGAENVVYSGGFFFTYEAAGEGTQIPGWVESSFKGDGNKKVFGIAIHKGMVSIVRSRRRWIRKDKKTGLTELRGWNSYESGFRAQYQGLGFIKGFESPVCFSFKGLSISNVDSILKEHYSKVVVAANKNAPDPKKGLPSYAFWTIIEAGPHEQVGSGDTSEVTPPRIVLPKIIDREALTKLYVGKERLLESQELYRLAEDWAHEWDRGGRNQGVDPNRAAFDAQDRTERQKVNDDPYGDAPMDMSQPDDADPCPF